MFRVIFLKPHECQKTHHPRPLLLSYFFFQFETHALPFLNPSPTKKMNTVAMVGWCQHRKQPQQQQQQMQQVGQVVTVQATAVKA
jgi:hypothetical protein